jgi:uncharacterized protein (TIGR03067 family)
MTCAAFAMVTLGFMTAADKPDLGRKDLDRLQGEWTMVSGRQDGKDAVVDPQSALRCTVRGAKVTFLRAGQIVEEVTVKLDASKQPKEIDSTLVNKKVAAGIYRLEDDHFTLCYASAGKSRPAEFSAKAGSGHSLSVWKRDKK